uniref:Uncharacterized protein n=1 Tax=Trypanosoma congolense (strain IL3000) TaxID=1068625 RepID=G0UUD8_TRYCI|nr:hypothetical protein, unlikely [Trypanosoma congolense IL3000]
MCCVSAMCMRAQKEDSLSYRSSGITNSVVHGVVIYELTYCKGMHFTATHEGVTRDGVMSSPLHTYRRFQTFPLFRVVLLSTITKTTRLRIITRQYLFIYLRISANKYSGTQ